MKNQRRTPCVLLRSFVIGSLFSIAACSNAQQTINTAEMTAIPLGGNAYVTEVGGIYIGSVHPGPRNLRLDDNGVTRWHDGESIVSTWFKTSRGGRLALALRARSEQPSSLRVSVEGQTFDVQIAPSEEPVVVPVGTVNLKKGGYVRVDLEGLEKEGPDYADVIDLMVGDEAASDSLNFVRPGFGYYWGRRGPSVHLKYDLPQDEQIEYFYNEVTVPEGEDVVGSYYMANGFGQGYFGMQVNSETERRVLFSVWSPFDTQDPSLIPDEQKIKMLEQGEGVHIGEFGNEGSGGQSYLIYPWKAGETYKFLTRVHPDGKGNTIYSAQFYAPEEGKWRLIATFLRPQTDTWYTGAHSFLENFLPTQGYITRCVEFGNQWLRTAKGDWREVTGATFTYDATAGAQMRVDYAGGTTDGGRFYLKNCGFFDDNTPYRSHFERPATGKMPEVKVAE